MDPRTAASIAFRVLGAYFAVNGLGSLAFLAASIDAPGRYVLSLFLNAAVMIGAGALLWVLADQLAAVYPATPATTGTDPDRVARVGIGLIGLAFLTLGGIELVQWIVQRGIDANTFFPNLSLPGFRGIIPPLVKAGAGLGLLVGAESIARSTFGARPSARVPQPIDGPNDQEGS